MRSRGILVVGGATVAMALGFGGLALISVFMRPLEAEFGWSRADTSLAYAVATVGMAVGGVVWGRMSDRVDIRILLAIGGSGMVLPLLAMAAVQSLWQTYLAHLVLSGFGFAVLYAPLLSATGEWFDRRRGLAVGVVTAGGALGQGVLPFLANMLIDELGWRLAFVSLAIATLIALALTLPCVTRPAGAKVTPGVAAYPTNLSREARGCACRSSQWRASCAALAWASRSSHLASFVGMICGSPAIGATSLLVAMLFGAVGRICFGLVADRIGYLPSYALASAIQTVCVAAYPLVGNDFSVAGAFCRIRFRLRREYDVPHSLCPGSCARSPLRRRARHGHAGRVGRHGHRRLCRRGAVRHLCELYPVLRACGRGRTSEPDRDCRNDGPAPNCTPPTTRFPDHCCNLTAGSPHKYLLQRMLPLLADFVAELGDRQRSRRREKDLKASHLPFAPEGTAASTRTLTHATLTQRTPWVVAAVWQRTSRGGAGSGRWLRA